MTRKKLTWHRAFDSAEVLYTGDVETWGSDDSEIVANRIVADMYHRNRRRVSLGSPILLPDPGHSSVGLGTLLDLHLWDVRKDVMVVHEYSRKTAPPLVWSWKHKALYALPGRKLPNVSVKATEFPKAYRLYRKWTKGKYPKGASRYRIPRIRLPAPQIAVAVGYRSDKFHADGQFYDYMHHFEKGVLGYVRPGQAFFVRGGRLTLTEDGLDH